MKVTKNVKKLSVRVFPRTQPISFTNTMCSLTQRIYYKNTFSFNMLGGINGTYSIHPLWGESVFKGNRKQYMITELYRSRISNFCSRLTLSERSGDPDDFIEDYGWLDDYYDDLDAIDFDELYI